MLIDETEICLDLYELLNNSIERKIPQKDHFSKRPIFFGTKDDRFAEVLLQVIVKVINL
jgi:hypothetical protein